MTVNAAPSFDGAAADRKERRVRRKGRSKLLIEIFGVVMRRTEVLNDRDSEVVRAAMGQRFEKAAQRGELSNAIPSGVLCDFYLINCFAAMASWGAQPIMQLGDMLRGVTTLFMNGAGPNK